MLDVLYKRLVRRGFLTKEALTEVLREAGGSPVAAEALLAAREIPKHELLRCLAEIFGRPYVEYVIVSRPCPPIS